MSTSADTLKGTLGHGEHFDLDFDKHAAHEHRKGSEVAQPSFPPELLDQIFKLTVQNTPTVFGTGKVICPPLKLAGVCSQWREHVMSSPAFWTNIELSMGLYSNTPSPDNSRNFKHAITGSGMVLNLWSAEHPLSVVIDLQDFVPAAQPILDIFVSCAPRWRSLEAWLDGIDDEETMQKLFGSISGRLPLLEHLSVHIRDSSISDLYVNNRQTVTLGSTPQLTTAILDVGKASEVVLPYEQLQELTLIHPRSEPTSAILSKSPNLKLLKIDNPSMEPHSLWQYKLPFVESLTLKFSFTRALCPFQYLYHLTLPNLSTLNLEANEYSSENLFARDIIDFVRRSSCSITSLTLAHLVIRPNELISILEELHELRQLKLAEKSPKHLISSQLFNALKITPAAKPLLPDLRELFIIVQSIESGYSFPSSSFIAVIEGRQHRPHSDDQGIAALHSAHVSVPQDAFTADEYLQLFGLGVEVESSTADSDSGGKY